MAGIVLHAKTMSKINDFVAQPAHALLISAQKGSGKGSLSRAIVSKLLVIDEDRVATHPYVRIITPTKQSISIDSVRELQHFLSLKMPTGQWRAVIIEDGHLLGIEAQNALLKMLEEPPIRTTIIITTASEQALLATVRSRMTRFVLQKPDPEAVITHFQQLGYSNEPIRQALLMSGGLPGLMTALLTEDMAHPLMQAANSAREIIQKPVFERLLLVDPLSKQRELAMDVLIILGQMAHVALHSPATTISATAATRWHRILKNSYEATELLLGSAQPKLVLTDLMLSL